MNLSPATLIKFICGDFEAAWNGISQLEKRTGGGNFMFAKMAITLLEVACRVCEDDKTGRLLKDFTAELLAIDPRYFADIPYHPSFSPKKREFILPNTLPTPNSRTGSQLIGLIFDLIRNGQAHQYQQILGFTSDKNVFGISVTGVEKGIKLSNVTTLERTKSHLVLKNKTKGSQIWVTVRTDVFFLDLKDSILRAGLDKGTIQHLERSYANIDGETLRQALISGL